MAKSFSIGLLKNQLGQSTVEYILLLAVLVSLGFGFFHNKKFLDFINAADGSMFESMRKGIGYSYRYGLEYKSSVPYDEKMIFDYKNNLHDSYTKDGTESRFFTGDAPYPAGP